VKRIKTPKIFKSLLTGINEFGEIVIMNLMPKEDGNHLKMVLKDFENTNTQFNLPKVAGAFIDNCCQYRQYYEESIPSLAGNLAPYTTKRDDIFLHTNTDGIAQILSSLADVGMRESTDPNVIEFGLDIKWQPALDGGTPGKAATIQIACSSTICHIWHLSNFVHGLPREIADFLQIDSHLFVGLGINSKIVKLSRDYPEARIVNVHTREVSEMAMNLERELRLDHLVQFHSLTSLSERYLRRKLHMSWSVRTVDWSRGNLPEDAIIYAAISALSSLRIYRAILKKDLSESRLIADQEAQSLTRVYLDSFHWFQRLPVSPKHSFSKKFLVGLSDVLFMWDSVYQAKLDAYLKTFGSSFETKLKTNRRWILKRCPRVTRPRNELLELFDNFIQHWKSAQYNDHATNMPLLSPELLKELSSGRVHIANGCLSDPIDLPMYIKIARVNGLDVFRCLRGTSDVEGGVHQKLIKSCGYWSSSPELIHYHLANYRIRHNVRVGERFRENFPKIGHFDHQLVETICLAAEKLYGRKVYHWNTVFGKSKGSQQFGVTSFLDPQLQDQFEPKDLLSLKPSIQFLAIRQRSRIPFLPVHTAEERNCFKAAIASYKQRHTFNYEKMATDWNNGCLKTISGYLRFTLDGIRYFKKNSYDLESYFAQSEKHSAMKIAELALPSGFDCRLIPDGSLRSPTNALVSEINKKEIVTQPHTLEPNTAVPFRPIAMGPGRNSAVMVQSVQGTSQKKKRKGRTCRLCNNFTQDSPDRVDGMDWCNGSMRGNICRHK
jgi:hypothetical protein